LDPSVGLCALPRKRGSNFVAPTRPSPRRHQCGTRIVHLAAPQTSRIHGPFSLRRGVRVGIAPKNQASMKRSLRQGSQRQAWWMKSVGSSADESDVLRLTRNRERFATPRRRSCRYCTASVFVLVVNFPEADDDGRSKKLFNGWASWKRGLLCPRAVLVVMAMEEAPGAPQLFSVSRQRSKLQV